MKQPVEMYTLTHLCQKTHITINTMELVVEFRRQDRNQAPVIIKGMLVEKVNSFKFLCIHITEDLTWSTHSEVVVKKAHQHLCFFRCRKLRLFLPQLT